MRIGKFTQYNAMKIENRGHFPVVINLHKYFQYGKRQFCIQRMTIITSFTYSLHIRNYRVNNNYFILIIELRDERVYRCLFYVSVVR